MAVKARKRLQARACPRPFQEVPAAGRHKGVVTMRSVSVTAVVILVTGFNGGAAAGVIETTPHSLAALAGGRLNTGTDVTIDGGVGAVGNIWLGNRTRVSGDLYTTGAFETGSYVDVGGRAVASGKVGMNRGSAVGAIDGGRSVTLGRDTVVWGDLTAAERVNIDRNAHMYGDVSYGTGYWVHSRATVDGALGQGPGMPDVWNPSLWTTPDLSTTGSGTDYYAGNSTVVLEPGDYGGLNVDGNSTVHLSAGTYDLAQAWLGRDTRIVADTSGGDVVVNIVGSLTSDRDVAFETVGEGTLVFHVGDYVYLGRGNEAEASFLSYGNLTADVGTLVSGHVFAGADMWLGNDVHIGGVFPESHLPEPATLGLIVAGLGWAALRRR